MTSIFNFCSIHFENKRNFLFFSFFPHLSKYPLNVENCFFLLKFWKNHLKARQNFFSQHIALFFMFILIIFLFSFEISSECQIKAESREILSRACGPNYSRIKTLEDALDVTITVKNLLIVVTGSPDNMGTALTVIKSFIAIAKSISFFSTLRVTSTVTLFFLVLSFCFYFLIVWQSIFLLFFWSGLEHPRLCISLFLSWKKTYAGWQLSLTFFLTVGSSLGSVVDSSEAKTKDEKKIKKFIPFEYPGCARSRSQPLSGIKLRNLGGV